MLSFVGMNQSLVNRAIIDIVFGKMSEKRLSRRKLGRLSGVSGSTLDRMWVYEYEVGMGNLVAIAGALDTTAAAIMQEALDRVGAEKAVEDVRARLNRGVSEGAAKVTDIAARQAAAEKLTAEDAENARANRRAAASEDDDATRDEPEGP